MKIIITLMIALASITMANDVDLDGRLAGIEVSFDIPTPSLTRDTVLNLQAVPKTITRFDEYIMLKNGPVEVENGIKAELAYLPWF